MTMGMAFLGQNTAYWEEGALQTIQSFRGKILVHSANFWLTLKYRAATIQSQALKNEVAVKIKKFSEDSTILNLSSRTSFRS